MSELIERQAVIDLWDKYHPTIAVDAMQYDVELMQLPPTQPEQYLDEWCTDCKEYDKEKHSCPRWNRVIRQTLVDAQPESYEDDPRADVYYLAEKIGIHQLYALVVQLRGEPESCDDAVSRKAVIESVRQDCFAVFTADERECEIRDLPSVTPKQRTGYWEIYVISPFDGEGCKCSECGFEGAPYWDYCPNCGLKMEGISE